MMNERILIIDTATQSQKSILDDILLSNGYQTFWALDKDEGWQLAATKQPHLVLLGASLSDVEKISFLQELRRQGLILLTIVMIEQESDPIPVGFLRLGVRDYITAPFDPPAILTAIERTLTETRLGQERTALTNSLTQANEQLDRHRRELNTLFGVGKSMTAALDKNQLLRRLVEAAIYLTHAEESSILLLDDKTGELYVAATRGMDDHVARSLRLRVSDSLAGDVVKSGQAFVLNESEITKIKTDYLVRSLMYVPLTIKGQIKGVLGVSNRHQAQDFTNHDLRLLSALSDYAAIFIENDHLADAVEQKGATLITTLNELEQAVVVISEQGYQVLWANRTFYRIFELNEETTQSGILTDLLQNQALSDFISAIPSLTHHHSEILVDEARTFSATSTPIAGVGYVIILRDITDLKTLNQIKSDFIATISHTLRSPLLSIQGYTDMLQAAGSMTEKQELFLGRIMNGLNKMITLVNKLLDLSSIEADLELNLAVTNLNDLAAEVVAAYQLQARRNHQQLVYHASSRPAQVIGVPTRFKQVISHLLENALEYTPSNGNISVITQVNREQVMLKIEDNGSGIPAHDLPFVFDKFFRVDPKNQTASGTGLGLAICKAIIEKYGGSIWVESIHRQGSTFFFTLPLVSSNTTDVTSNDMINVETIST